jgi:chemotaxis signal transduction protein
MSEAYILSEVAGTSYAVASADILHMEMVDTITAVPNAAPFVDGIVLLRGKVVPVVNMRARFGFERIPCDLRTRLLVVQAEGRVLGLLVDSAREFVRLAPDEIKPPHEVMADASGAYVAGVATRNDRIVLVLDLTKLLEGAAAPVAA